MIEGLMRERTVLHDTLLLGSAHVTPPADLYCQLLFVPAFVLNLQHSSDLRRVRESWPQPITVGAVLAHVSLLDSALL